MKTKIKESWTSLIFNPFFLSSFVIIPSRFQPSSSSFVPFSLNPYSLSCITFTSSFWAHWMYFPVFLFLTDRFDWPSDLLTLCVATWAIQCIWLRPFYILGPVLCFSCMQHCWSFGQSVHNCSFILLLMNLNKTLSSKRLI